MNVLSTNGSIGTGYTLIGSAYHYEYLYKYAIHKINDKELAKDLVQDTFLTALEAEMRFEQRSSERTWLTAILKYKIFRVYRGRKKRVITGENEDFTPLEAALADYPAKEQRQPDKMLDREFADAINTFLMTQPVKWQELYHLKYIQEENGGIICKKLNIMAENYWVMSFRLKAALKNWCLKIWTVD